MCPDADRLAVMKVMKVMKKKSRQGLDPSGFQRASGVNTASTSVVGVPLDARAHQPVTGRACLIVIWEGGPASSRLRLLKHG